MDEALATSSFKTEAVRTTSGLNIGGGACRWRRVSSLPGRSEGDPGGFCGLRLLKDENPRTSPSER